MFNQPGLGFSRMGDSALGRFDPSSLFAKYQASGLYIPDFNPARPAASGLGRLYTTDDGDTLVSAVADPIGLILEESQGAAIGADVIVNGGFAADANWTKGTGWTIGSGVATGAGVPSGSAGRLLQSPTLEDESFYRFIYDVPTLTLGAVGAYVGGGAGVPRSIAGSFSEFVKALTVDSIGLERRNNDFSGTVDNISARKVAGKHALQATAGSRGTLRQVGSRYVWRGDGTDDNLLTTLNPAAAMTMIVACEFNAVDDIVVGAQGAANANRCWMGTDINGKLCAGVGTQDGSTIFGGADIRDVAGIAALRITGAVVSLFWKPFGGPLSRIYEAAQAGTPITTVPLRLGSRNANGTADVFHDGDQYAHFHIQAALTDAEIAAVANVFSR